jgi:very-short-patch-repair endonuclease
VEGSISHRTARELAEAQLDLITSEQMLDLGFSEKAIEHRISRRRLHPIWPGVYAVSSRRMTRNRLWMAAILACGPGAALSHGHAGALLGIAVVRGRKIDVSIPAGCDRRPKGIRVHRRKHFEVTTHRGIPVTTPACTIVDLATERSRDEVEHAISQADLTGLLKVPALVAAVQEMPRRPGLGKARQILDRRTFRLTRSQLERRFLKIVERAGLPVPETCVKVNGFEVDFYWPDLKLVVETDGLTYHRTPQQQARDLIRNQVHAASRLTPLRFSHDQIAYEPAHVEEILYMSSIVSASSPTSRNSV